MWIKYNKQLINIDNSFCMYYLNENGNEIKIKGIDADYTNLYLPSDVKIQKIFDAITHCISQNKNLFDVDEFLKTGIIV